MWYKVTGSEVEIHVYAKPGARRDEITGVTEKGLGIALRAQPKEGEANAALIVYLSDYFNIPKTRIELVRGKASRSKVVKMPLTQSVEEFLSQYIS